MSTQGSRRSMTEPSMSKRNSSPAVILKSNQYSNRSSLSQLDLPCDQCRFSSEYILLIKQALKEVLDQNDALRSRTCELEAIYSQSEDELKLKAKTISELKEAQKH